MLKLGLGLVMVTIFSGEVAAAPELSDPTRPLGFQAGKAKTTGYQLSSIFVSAHSARAIVNGQLVGVNDYVDQAKVVKIDSGMVVLLTPTGPKTLQLHKNIKRISRAQ